MVRKTTLLDVANKAGFSTTTVSMVLSEKGNISESTRLKVVKAANELGYTKKNPYRSLSNQRSEIIGLLLLIDKEWGMAFNFLIPLINSIQKEVSLTNKTLVTIFINHFESVKSIIKKIKVAQCSALFTIHYVNKELIYNIETQGIPGVIIMNNNFQDEFFSICVDDYQGSYEGALHLINLGHKNIAYIDSTRLDLPALSSDRYIGFKKALDESNLTIPANWHIEYIPNAFESFENNIKKIYSSKSEKPSAFFCLDDDIAWKLIIALSKINIKVPDDVSVIAPGDILDYTIPNVPKITTMKINTAYMGVLAAQMMERRLNDQNSNEIHVLKVKQQLIKRGSTQQPV